ncbi:MAG: LysM peptidoglycan-binding domain-containing M23 family metallopeptidase [Deltaproteobacteria bacterium]|nr:LysM peptidoglycan-binding domain-containing M23 family metallopeptidase [Deltaproteobacteria bacterium]
MNRINLIVVFICLALISSGCSQFQAVFNKEGRASPHALTKGPQTKKTVSQKIKNKDATIEKKDHKKTKPPKEQKKIKKQKQPAPLQIQGDGRQPIVTKKGTYYFVVKGDTISLISEKYKISRDHLAQINDLYNSDLVAGRRIFIPNRKTKKDFLSVTDIIRAKKIERERSLRSIKFIWPLKEYVITSGFGWRRGRPHEALDLSAKRGTPVFAATDGVVIFAERYAGYGNLLVLKHAKNYFTAYAHLHTMQTEVGKKVKKGEQIATVGNTGRSSGPHLHFEIHKKTQAIDPLKLLPKKK